MTESIHYTIVPSRPEAHLFQVGCQISEPDPQGQVFSMPAWIPGSYMIRDFAKNIVRLQARCQGQPVELTKLDKQTWQCAPCEGPLRLDYEIYAWDLSVRSAHLDSNHGYFNGTSVFMRIHGQDQQPCSVDILPPAGVQYSEWRLATSLTRDGASLFGFGRYRAADYDDLVDHPVEMSDFQEAGFTVAGVPHHLVISGRVVTDLPRICQDLEKICNTHVQLFGELPDMERYVFITLAVGEGYGGLEHRASCSLISTRNDLPAPGQTKIDEGYRRFLGLCSHEYFHTWNIKRIKPAVFCPYDLSREVHTQLLWAFEGITSYYDDLGLLRAGVIDLESYLELLGQMITRVLRTKGRLKQTVTESSFDTWTKFYKQDENAPNAIVSYYAKGALVALALDLSLRERSQDRVSLDDVMRALWQRYGKRDIGVGEQDIQNLVNELAGADLTDFFAHALYSTEDLPLDQFMGNLGLTLKLRPALSHKDNGGKPAPQDAPARLDLGMKMTQEAAGIRITHVLEGGPAMAAGIAAGDVLLALDGLKVTVEGLDSHLARYQGGDCVVVHVFRGDELLVLPVKPAPAPVDTCYIEVQQEADSVRRARRERWMRKSDGKQNGESKVDSPSQKVLA